MTKQIINIGTAANSKNGDPLRTAFSKVNDNFTELYNAVAAGVGIVGPKGDTGAQGIPGATGPQGSIGPAGPQGPQGDIGPQGPQGSIGPQGVKGDNGSQGIQGIQGVQGVKGDTGTTGPKGDAGSQGIQGVQGPIGNDGPQGIQGVKGDKGDQGNAGLQGLQGVAGNDGPQGVKGDTGAQGVSVTLQGTLALIADLDTVVNPQPGDAWIVTESNGGDLYFYTPALAWDNVGKIVGPQGNQGIQGVKGDQGIPGIQGDQGIQGIPGAQGLQGVKGDKGDQGIQGPEGNANTGNIGFLTDFIYDYNGVTIENADPTHGATSAVIIPGNGVTDPLQVNNFYGPVNITSGTNNITSTWAFGADGSLTTPGNVNLKDNVKIEALDIAALYDAYQTAIIMLDNQFTSLDYTGLGYPASKSSYQQLLRAKAINPLISDSLIVIAKNLEDSYYMWAAATATIASSSSGLTITNGDNVGWRFEASTGLQFPDATLQRTAFTGTAVALANGSKTVTLSSSGIITLPSNSYLESIDTNLKVGAQGTVTIRSNAASNITTKEWNFDIDGHLVPGSDILQDIGTPTNRVRHIYVGPGSISIGDSVLSESTTGKLVVPGLTRATSLHADEVEDTADQTHTFAPNSEVVVVDAALYAAIALNADTSYFADYTATTDSEGYIDNIQINGAGTYSQAEADVAKGNMYAYVGAGSASDRPIDPQDWMQIPFRLRTKANDVEYEFNTGGGGNANTGDVLFDGNRIYVANGSNDLTLDGVEVGVNVISQIYSQINYSSTGEPNSNNGKNSYVWVDENGVHIQNTADGDNGNYTYEWDFGTNGKLQLPPGGDIVNSNGTSVLGNGGGSGLVQRTVNYPTGEAGDISGTIALDPQGNVYVCTANYQQNEGQGYSVVTSELYNISQSGGTLMSVVIALGDYPAIDAILQAATLPMTTGWQVSGNVTDGYVRDCIAEQWTGNRWGFTWTYVSGQDESSYSQGEPFQLTYTAPQADIWEQVNTGGALTDRLVSGDNELLLDVNGNVITPGSVIIGGANVNNETHLVIDGANYWTSIQWKNFPAQQTTAAPFECQSQLLRVFRGENGIQGHEELVAVTANTDNGDENALMITTSKGKIPDAPYNDGVGVQHNFIFGGDGKMQFPDGTKQATAYVSRNINLDGGGASVQYEAETAFVDGGFSSTRHGVADAMFDGGNRLTENNLYNLDGGRA